MERDYEQELIKSTRTNKKVDNWDRVMMVVGLTVFITLVVWLGAIVDAVIGLIELV